MLNVTREMQIKASMRCYYMFITMIKVKKTKQVLVRIWNDWNSHMLLVGMGSSLTHPYKVKYIPIA